MFSWSVVLPEFSGSTTDDYKLCCDFKNYFLHWTKVEFVVRQSETSEKKILQIKFSSLKISVLYNNAMGVKRENRRFFYSNSVVKEHFISRVFSKLKKK